jgi:hypothetical protein
MWMRDFTAWSKTETPLEVRNMIPWKYSSWRRKTSGGEVVSLVSSGCEWDGDGLGLSAYWLRDCFALFGLCALLLERHLLHRSRRWP